MPKEWHGYNDLWGEEKPPLYWRILAVCLVSFAVLWVLTIPNLAKFSTPQPDTFHSVMKMDGNQAHYYPRAVVWIVHYGPPVLMVWMFLLGLIMFLKRPKLANFHK